MLHVYLHEALMIVEIRLLAMVVGTEQVKALRRKKLQGEDCDPSYICSSRLSPSPSLVTVVSPSYICSLYNNCCLFSSKAIIVTKLSSLHLIEPIDMKKLSHYRYEKTISFRVQEQQPIQSPGEESDAITTKNRLRRG